jgi:hypothetical protein
VCAVERRTICETRGRPVVDDVEREGRTDAAGAAVAGCCASAIASFVRFDVVVSVTSLLTVTGVGALDVGGRRETTTFTAIGARDADAASAGAGGRVGEKARPGAEPRSEPARGEVVLSGSRSPGRDDSDVDGDRDGDTRLVRRRRVGRSGDGASSV